MYQIGTEKLGPATKSAPDPANKKENTPDFYPMAVGVSNGQKKRTQFVSKIGWPDGDVLINRG
jgi:hypothetical protein